MKDDDVLGASAQSCPVRWCILRTGGARTIPLAYSLADAGIEVWTPIQTEKRKLPRGRRGSLERQAPILPTFVFAKAGHMPELARILSLPVNPHPSFSIFRYLGRVALVADAEIANLHAVEERAKKAVAKTKRYVFPVGDRVRVTEGAAAGMSGVVEDGDGKFAMVAFAGAFRIRIATFLLEADALGSGQP